MELGSDIIVYLCVVLFFWFSLPSGLFLQVRKICQTVAFLSPAVCMTLSSVDLGLPPWEIVGILTGGLALSSFALSGKWQHNSRFFFFFNLGNCKGLTCHTYFVGWLIIWFFSVCAGLYCTHQDMSPEYASILLVCKLTILNSYSMCWNFMNSSLQRWENNGLLLVHSWAPFCLHKLDLFHILSTQNIVPELHASLVVMNLENFWVYVCFLFWFLQWFTCLFIHRELQLKRKQIIE